MNHFMLCLEITLFPIIRKKTYKCVVWAERRHFFYVKSDNAWSYHLALKGQKSSCFRHFSRRWTVAMFELLTFGSFVRYLFWNFYSMVY